MIDNCTAELYCAGKCVGSTLWSCAPNTWILLAVGAAILLGLWLFYEAGAL